MMKFVAVLALLLVAVSAKEHFKQPKFPCAYEMKMSASDGDESYGEYKLYMNGRYVKLKVTSEEEKGYNGVLLVRPDLGGEGKFTVFEGFGEYCYSAVMDNKDLPYFLDSYGKVFLEYADDKDWDHKETKTWKGKKCTHYYDDDEDESIYVYDDRVYGYVENDFVIVFEYEWKASMDEFVLKEKDYPECVKENKKVTEVPSDDYVFCAASSLKVAFVAVVAALVSSLF